MCTCGCGQNLTIQTIRKHQKNQTIPRLVTAAVQVFHTHGSTVSPPRPAKKPRTSRDYFPSSPSQSAGLNTRIPMDGVEYVDVDAETGDDSDNIDNMIHRVQVDIWPSQFDLFRDQSDSEDDQEASNESEDDEAGDDDGDSDSAWEAWQDGTGNSYELSAVDLLGEEFERNAVANGEFLTILDLLIIVLTPYSI